MGAGGDYYGYIPGSTPRIRQDHRDQRHFGEDLSHYSTSDGDSYEETPKPPDSLHEGAETRHMMLNSIEKIKKRILAQQYTMVQDASNGWRDIADYLTNLSTQIRGQSDGLRTGGTQDDPGWSSPGADVFMA